MTRVFSGIRGEMIYDRPYTGGCEEFFQHFQALRTHTGGSKRFNLTKISGTATGGNLSAARMLMYLRSTAGTTRTVSWGINERGWKHLGVVPAGQYAFSVRPCYEAGGRSRNLWFHGTLETSIGTAH